LKINSKKVSGFLGEIRHSTHYFQYPYH